MWQHPLHSTAASRVLRLLLPLLMSGDDLGAPLLRRRRLEVVARRVRGHVGLLHREELRHTRRRAVQPREVLRAHRLEGAGSTAPSEEKKGTACSIRAQAGRALASKPRIASIFSMVRPMSSKPFSRQCLRNASTSKLKDEPSWRMTCCAARSSHR